MKWISVKDELPEEVRQVLVCGSLKWVSIGQFFGDHWYADQMHFPLDKITHWMPLPELPKK